jgi:hypothetical protein
MVADRRGPHVMPLGVINIGGAWYSTSGPPPSCETVAEAYAAQGSPASARAAGAVLGQSGSASRRPKTRSKSPPNTLSTASQSQ